MTGTKVLLSRWQFGITITYHFLFVPLTIGLVFLVAVMQVLAYRTKDEEWERLTRFFGTLFLINFAMGIVTSISVRSDMFPRLELPGPGLVTNFQALNRRWLACHLRKSPRHRSSDSCRLVTTRPFWRAISARDCCRICK